MLHVQVLAFGAMYSHKQMCTVTSCLPLKPRRLKAGRRLRPMQRRRLVIHTKNEESYRAIEVHDPPSPIIASCSRRVLPTRTFEQQQGDTACFHPALSRLRLGYSTRHGRLAQYHYPCHTARRETGGVAHAAVIFFVLCIGWKGKFSLRSSCAFKPWGLLT